MPVSSLDLTKHAELAPLADLVAAMYRVKADARPLLVGAMARDVLLTFAHGIRCARATQDMDFAFALDNWAQFSTWKERLLAKTFGHC